MTRGSKKPSSRAGAKRQMSSKARKTTRSVKRNAYTRLSSLFATSALILAGTSLVLFTLGIMSNLGRFAPQPTSPKSTLSHVNSSSKMAASAGSSCDNATQIDPQFSACPSFQINYTTGHHDLDTTIFNVNFGSPGVNGEAEYYTGNPANLYVANESLTLEARKQPYNGYQYTSARIDTKGKEDFLYGKLVVRAKLPAGAGTWPAIWMLPSKPTYASQGPASNPSRYLNDGEIDLAEAVGIQPNLIYGVAHSLAYPENGPDRSYYNTKLVPDSSQAFHDYELNWTPTSLTFSIDGVPFYTYEKQTGADWHSWPFDQPFYLIINLALGGTWAGSNLAFPSGIDNQALPATLQVQSIRYYSYVQKP